MTKQFATNIGDGIPALYPLSLMKVVTQIRPDLRELAHEETLQ